VKSHDRGQRLLQKKTRKEGARTTQERSCKPRQNCGHRKQKQTKKTMTSSSTQEHIGKLSENLEEFRLESKHNAFVEPIFSDRNNKV